MKHYLDYMIAVMKAAKEGKEIQYRECSNGLWLFVIGTCDFDWSKYDYRIKPEEQKTEYVPYENAEEFLQAQKKHGMHIRNSYAPYINADNHIALISEARIAITDFECMLHNYVWQDGTPCGKIKTIISMKPTYKEALEAARIIRQYMNGEKVCDHYTGKEAYEIARCSYILQKWTYDGKYTNELINKDFVDEYRYAHRVSIDNYHAEEASVGQI